MIDTGQVNLEDEKIKPRAAIDYDNIIKSVDLVGPDENFAPNHVILPFDTVISDHLGNFTIWYHDVSVVKFDFF